jgi:hypothetical protein
VDQNGGCVAQRGRRAEELAGTGERRDVKFSVLGLGFGFKVES